MRVDTLSESAELLAWGEEKVIVYFMFMSGELPLPKERGFYLNKGNARHKCQNLTTPPVAVPTIPIEEF
jgi:hypothetical protein